MEELIINLQELLLPRLILDNQCFIGRWHVAYRLGRKPFLFISGDHRTCHPHPPIRKKQEKKKSTCHFKESFSHVIDQHVNIFFMVASETCGD
jgi:hypothetical protein